MTFAEGIALRTRVSSALPARSVVTVAEGSICAILRTSSSDPGKLGSVLPSGRAGMPEGFATSRYRAGNSDVRAFVRLVYFSTAPEIGRASCRDIVYIWFWG